MNHFVSVSIDEGTNCKDALRVPLYDVVEHFGALAKPAKTDNTLIFGVYLDLPDAYERKGLEEHPGAKINTLFIDCDNGEKERPETWDANIVEKFREDMKEYKYIMWETYSSTKERPKFRALIPLDRTIKFSKFVKQAIFHVFKDYADSHCTWYFTPDTRHLDTVEQHMSDEFKLFGADVISNIAEQKRSQQEKLVNWSFQIHNASRGICKSPDGWRNLPSVKKCLEGLLKGERDDSLNRACYAMKQNGYLASIPEFLDEVDVPNDMKLKFRGRYR